MPNFDTIWHGDALWPSRLNQPIKLQYLRMQYHEWPPSSKLKKLRYLEKHCTIFHEIWHHNAPWWLRPKQLIKFKHSKIRQKMSVILKIT